MADKKISAWLATAVGLGAIIGAGIFVLSGTAIALAGSDALIAFILVGIVALIVAYELGELGSLMPYAKGASYSYTYKAFGSEMGFITGMLMYFSFATSISVVALGFGSYLASMLNLTAGYFPIMFAMALIAVLALVNIFGLKDAIKTDFALVVIKVAILMIFIGFAMYLALSHPGVGAGHFNFTFTNMGIGAIFAASVAVFFAYSGFQTISTFTSKIRGGGISAAKSMIAAVLISITIYALVVYSLLLLLPPSMYKVSADPLSFALLQSGAPKWLYLLVGVGALFATASATLAMILSSSRSLYQMGLDKLMPKVVRAYDKKRDSAVNSIVISAAIGIVMLFAGNIYIIASISNFGLLFSYLMVGLAVVHFRRIGSKPSFKIPFYPYTTFICTIAIMSFLIGMPREALIIGLGLVLSLIAVYYSVREVKEKKVIRVRLFD
jgi:APA family basic amino acid/polyamine antiporter